MNLENERKAFEEYYIANYHDGDIHPHKKLLEWCEDSESYINSTIDNLWDMWQASANREGYKFVPKYHQENIKDALIIACDIKEDEQRFEDSLNYVHEAMIGACDE